MKIEYEKIDIMGPMVADYDLNQCVTIKSQIKKYRVRLSNWYALGMLVFLGGWGLIAGCVWLLDWLDIISYVADDIRDYCVPLFVFMLISFVICCKSWAYDDLTHALNDRIDVLGGLDDGKKGQE